MKKLLVAMTALPALLIAAPATAQVRGHAEQRGNIDHRLMQLESRLNAGVQSGDINRREAMTLRRQLAELQRLERRYSMNGLTRQEQNDLQQRMRTLRQSIRVADGGGWDRNERWDDDRYTGRGGPYEAWNNGDRGRNSFMDLRVGARVGTGLQLVPNAYRSRYRDSGNYHYRTDGRNIYRIDARTNTVVSIHPM